MGTKINLGIGMFVLLALVGTTYLIVDTDKAYSCEATGVVGYCWDLSEPNENTGLINRCYYNETEPTRYKKCKSGWEKFKELEVNGTIIDYQYEGIETNFTKNKEDKLKEKGIKDPEIIRKKNRFNKCVFQIYEESGINKEIEFECSYCVQYDWVEEVETCETREVINYTESINESNNKTIYLEELINQTTCSIEEGYNNSDCVNYYSLTDEEIEIKKFEEANKKLEWIADKLIVRDLR